jgi:hypothetical protein
MITPQIAILSGNQFVQRGKKFAIEDQPAHPTPDGPRQLKNEPELRLGCASFRCEKFDVDCPSAAIRKNSMNRCGIGKENSRQFFQYEKAKNWQNR